MVSVRGREQAGGIKCSKHELFGVNVFALLEPYLLLSTFIPFSDWS